MCKTLTFICFLALLSLNSGEKTWREEMYESCRHPLPKKDYDLWNLPMRWFRYAAYPPFAQDVICLGDNKFLGQVLHNLTNPPLEYIPPLPLPMLLCTDYQYYAVLIFCEIKRFNNQIQKRYNQAMILTHAEMPSARTVALAKKCLKDFNYRYLRQMQVVNYQSC
ncbi:uncharacterized protein LOC115626169 [Scaptodrosophila lebanonensis]|uniref:Uncharacterized protein LOC115626169 n=1 Tax=Drosophila lebanonensis TaxID=7225 RepID=A0A6J2TMP9_DROLE|nr:uncharacterized protein LOC115626169 [Scaptodrosophila lebanonensis]